MPALRCITPGWRNIHPPIAEPHGTDIFLLPYSIKDAVFRSNQEGNHRGRQKHTRLRPHTAVTARKGAPRRKGDRLALAGAQRNWYSPALSGKSKSETYAVSVGVKWDSMLKAGDISVQCRLPGFSRYSHSCRSACSPFSSGKRRESH